MTRKLEKENICPDHFPNFNLKSSIIIIIKNMFIMKNRTDSRSGENRCGSAPASFALSVSVSFLFFSFVSSVSFIVDPCISFRILNGSKSPSFSLNTH